MPFMQTLGILSLGAFVGCGLSNPCPSAGPTCIVAAIHVSASTNSAPIEVVVHGDGSAERAIEEGSTNIAESPKSFAAGDADVEQFLSDLEAAGDVTSYSIDEVDCPKSGSVGTTTTITSVDETSGDVQCLTQNASAAQRAVAHDCDVLTGRQP